MKYKLDLDDDNEFGDWTFLHFHTAATVYSFADSLNRLYGYRLTRIDPMTVDDIQWPLYRHEDPVAGLILLLTERPAQTEEALWGAGDKLLAVKGENSAEVADTILNDLAGSAVFDEADLLAREHADLVDDLLANFTVATLLDFTSPPLSRKAAKEFALARQFCNSLLSHVEQHHLDLGEEERLRLALTSAMWSK